MEPNEQLSGLLKQWKSVEPRADFEARVLTRLHAAPQPAWTRGALLARFRNWFRIRDIPWESAGALAGIAAGLLVAVQTLPPDAAATDAHFSILHSGGLTGGYVQMVRGGAR